MNSTGSQSRGPWFVTQRYVASTCANSPDADARLRAAAPTMLEALIAAEPLLEGFADGDRCDDDEEPIVQPILDAVRAAIKQARGQ